MPAPTYPNLECDMTMTLDDGRVEHWRHCYLKRGIKTTDQGYRHGEDKPGSGTRLESGKEPYELSQINSNTTTAFLGRSVNSTKLS